MRNNSLSAYETVLNLAAKNTITLSTKHTNGSASSINPNANPSRTISLNFNSPKNGNATIQKPTLFSNNGKIGNAVDTGTTNSSSTSTANLIKASQNLLNANNSNRNRDTSTARKNSRAWTIESTTSTITQKTDIKGHSIDRNITKSTSGTIGGGGDNVVPVTLNKKANRGIISQSLNLKDVLNNKEVNNPLQEISTNKKTKLTINTDFSNVNQKYTKSTRSLSTKHGNIRDNNNNNNIDGLTDDALILTTSSSEFKFMNKFKRSNDIQYTCPSESSYSTIRHKTEETETDEIIQDKILMRKESACRNILSKNAHMERSTPRAASTSKQLRSSLALTNILNESNSKTNIEDRALKSISRQNGPMSTKESLSNKVFLKQQIDSKGVIKPLVNDENMPINPNSLADDGNSMNSPNSKLVKNLKSSQKSQKFLEEKNMNTNGNGVTIQKASLSSFVTKVAKGEDFISKINTNESNNSSTKRINKNLTISTNNASSDDKAPSSKVVKAVLTPTPSARTTKQSDTKALFFTNTKNSDQNSNITPKQNALSLRSSGKIYDTPITRSLSNAASPFIYYMTNLEKSHKMNDNDYFSGIYREHFVQTFQAMHYCKFLKPVDPKVIAQKKVFLEKREKYEDKRTLIFDLDETLIHCNENADMPNDVKLPIRFPNGECIEAGINIRPYAIDILKELSTIYEIIVFTASHSCYANVVLDYLDPKNQYIHHRLFREACVPTEEGVYIKDLRILANRNLEDVIIVDNAGYSFGYQIDNGIPIIPYYDNKNDEELRHLIPFLRFLSSVKDLRDAIRQTFKLSYYANFDTQEKVLEKLVYTR